MTVYNNANLVALRWEEWVTAVLVANGGWFKADQDLTNLVIGRQDIPVHYLPGRFNVHLAVPDTIQGVGLVKPICAYNLASSVLAALGARDVVSFAHWWVGGEGQVKNDTAQGPCPPLTPLLLCSRTWMVKPWTKPTVEGLINQRAKLPARMMVIAQTRWYNEYGESCEVVRGELVGFAAAPSPPTPPPSSFLPPFKPVSPTTRALRRCSSGRCARWWSSGRCRKKSHGSALAKGLVGRGCTAAGGVARHGTSHWKRLGGGCGRTCRLSVRRAETGACVSGQRLPRGVRGGMRVARGAPKGARSLLQVEYAPHVLRAKHAPHLLSRGAPLTQRAASSASETRVASASPQHAAHLSSIATKPPNGQPNARVPPGAPLFPSRELLNATGCH